MRKWFLEIVQDFDGRYYCNLTIDGGTDKRSSRICGLQDLIRCDPRENRHLHCAKEESYLPAVWQKEICLY